MRGHLWMSSFAVAAAGPGIVSVALAADVPVGVAADPNGGGAAVVLEPVPGNEAPRAVSRRLVFSCVGDGHVTFADRPCGPAHALRELRITEPTTALVPQPTGSARTVSKSRVESRERAEAAVTGPTAEQRAAACARLDRALQALDDRMRAGYTAREAGHLWDRWRETKDRRREAGC
jgi:hypothetical protein